MIANIFDNKNQLNQDEDVSEGREENLKGQGQIQGCEVELESLKQKETLYQMSKCIRYVRRIYIVDIFWKVMTLFLELTIYRLKGPRYVI